MLQKLIIRNYAIIDNLTIEPDLHLNTVTGETGAGKSIILGALSLILGERADTSVLINKEEKCVVEAHFNVKDNQQFTDALREQELDEDAVCIIRREINASGKSRAFINDTPVNLQLLNRFTSLLVDLHQQFGHLALEDDRFQMDVVDAIAGNWDLRKQYAAIYRDYVAEGRQLAALRQRQSAWQKEADYKQFLFDELHGAAFKDDEIELAEQQLRQLSHAEKIIGVLQAGRMSLEEGEQPVANEVRRICQQLQSITDLMPGTETLQQRLSSAYAELKDIASELQVLEDKTSMDPALMLELQDRVDLGYKLCKKHGVNSTGELLELHASLEQELKATLDLADQIAALEASIEAIRHKLFKTAAQLTKARNQAAPAIDKKINDLLKLVGMPNARFRTEVHELAQPDGFGMDSVKFLLDANKSGQFLPVYKAASGGEMSRIMLCIKSLTAKALHLPTLIFDEVDTGISGEAARQVGVLLRDLASYHQVICITHQPQVAARGSRHFFVFKDLDQKQRITTRVRILQPDERVLAIAQMIGGDTPSEAAMQNARELVTL